MENQLSKNKIAKKVIIDEITEKFKRAKGVILIEYRGLTVTKISKLRASLRTEGVEYKVYKNTFASFATDAAKMDPKVKDYLKGPVAIAFSYQDSVSGLKLLKDYIKKNDGTPLKLKAGYVDNRLFNEKELDVLAKLPSRNELISMVLGTMNAPITSFVNVLAANIRGLCTVLNAVKEQKEKQG